MAKFKKGDPRANRSGRPKGARNRNSAEVQAALLKLLDDNLPQLSEDFKGLPPDKRVDLLIKLARHVVPAALNPERLTVEQLAQLLDYIKENNPTADYDRLRAEGLIDEDDEKV